MRNRLRSLLAAVVLATFVLPWFTVSCSGQPVVTVSGAHLVLGAVDTGSLVGMTEGDPLLQTALSSSLELLTWARAWAAAALLSAVLSLLATTRARAVLGSLLPQLSVLLTALLLTGFVAGPYLLRLRLAAALGSDTGPLGYAADSAVGSALLESVHLAAGDGYKAALAASMLLVVLSLGQRRERLPARDRATSPARERAAPSPVSNEPQALEPSGSQLRPGKAEASSGHAVSAETHPVAPGLFEAEVTVSIYRDRGSGWEHLRDVEAPEGRTDLAAHESGIGRAIVTLANGRAKIGVDWEPPLVLGRGQAHTVFDPAPTSVIVWPGDTLSAGDVMLAFADSRVVRR